jgi:iron complex transport system substrate-binding protein
LWAFQGTPCARAARGRRSPKSALSYSAKIDKILALQPDCVFGFSDLQADIASRADPQGVQVTVFNQRSVDEIFSMLYQVAAMVGQAQQPGLNCCRPCARGCCRLRPRAAQLPRRPRVFFEEWDEPHISAIRGCRSWRALRVGTTSFPSWPCKAWARTASLPTAREIVRRNPDIIIGSWCGKKFRAEKVAARAGWQTVNAVKKRAAVRDQIGRHPAARPGRADGRRGATAPHRGEWAAQHA